MLVWIAPRWSSKTNSSPERPRICRSTDSTSGNLASVSVATTRRRLSSSLRLAVIPPKYALTTLARTMVNTTTSSMGNNNWNWIGHRMIGLPGYYRYYSHIFDLTPPRSVGRACRADRHQRRANRHGWKRDSACQRYDVLISWRFGRIRPVWQVGTKDAYGVRIAHSPQTRTLETDVCESPPSLLLRPLVGAFRLLH